MAYYRNEWITFKLNGSQLNGILAKWMDHSYWMADSWMAYHRIEWITVLNGSPYWMDYHIERHITELNGSPCDPILFPSSWINTELNGSPYWMAHRELNPNLRSKNLVMTPLHLIQSSGEEVSSSWRTSCSYNLEMRCSMCRGSFKRTCPMNYLRLQYLGWNKSVVSYLCLQEPIRTWTIWLWVSLQYYLPSQPAKIFFIHLVIMHVCTSAGAQEDRNST